MYKQCGFEGIPAGRYRNYSLGRIATIRRSMNLVRWARGGCVLLILALGIGVFLWGTAYKMSLYESSPIHNKIPIAKLSSQASTADKDKADSATTPDFVPALPLLFDLALLVFALHQLVRFSRRTPADEPHRLVAFLSPPALFRRPPPFSYHG
jgi:hypothetical protein